jgi:hypothetical protein
MLTSYRRLQRDCKEEVARTVCPIQSSQITSPVSRKGSGSLLLAFVNQTGYTKTKPDVNSSLLLMWSKFLSGPVFEVIA